MARSPRRGSGGRAPAPSLPQDVGRADRALLIRAFFRRRRPREGEQPEGSVHFIASGPGETARLALQTHREVIRASAARGRPGHGVFFPPGRILRELRRAVGRGVRVRLLVTRHTDVPAMRWAARGLYGRLLRAGVEVYEYLPAMMHAKLAIADETLLVGSANLDLRSDRLNHELTAVVRDPTLAAAARREFEADLARPDRVDLAAWRSRSPFEKLREALSYWLIARADIFFRAPGCSAPAGRGSARRTLDRAAAACHSRPAIARLLRPPPLLIGPGWPKKNRSAKRAELRKPAPPAMPPRLAPIRRPRLDRRLLPLALIIVLAVAAIYGQTFRHEFIAFDDDTYILNNPG